MGFLKKISRKEKTNSPVGAKRPFYKKKAWRVFFLIFGVFLICLISFGAYIYANGSKVFENGFGNGSIAKAIRGDKLNGEDQGRVNIVLLGRGGDSHPGGLLTDSIMILSLNTKDKKMAMFSLPRDLLVPIPGHGQDKINAAYADGYNDYLSKSCKKKNRNDCKDDAMAAGSQLTSQTLSNILGIPIHYYVMADFEGFKELIDEVGGVDINVDKAIYDPLYPDKTMTGYEPLYIKAGPQHMNGDLALKYARSRETSSDFDRSRRQQQIASALKDKASSSGILANPKKIMDIVNIIGNHVRTNFSPADIKTLADRIKEDGAGNIITKVIANDTGGLLVSDSSTGTYYLKPKGGNFDEIRRFVNNIFQDVDAQQADAKIEVLNGSKTPGLATKAAEKVKNGGYNVIKIDTAASKTAKTIIYDYSSGSQKTAIEKLKQLLKAEVVEKKPDSGKAANISIVIGDDYNSSILSSTKK